MQFNTHIINEILNNIILCLITYLRDIFYIDTLYYKINLLNIYLK